MLEKMIFWLFKADVSHLKTSSHSLHLSFFLKVTSCSLPLLTFCPRCPSTCSGLCSARLPLPRMMGCCWGVWLLRSVQSTSFWPAYLPSAITLPECPVAVPTPVRSVLTHTPIMCHLVHNNYLSCDNHENINQILTVWSTLVHRVKWIRGGI